MADLIETDALIIGAGPVGLFQVFELGLQGIKAHVVDALPYAGGQCVELYADKPIYDIPGVPVCSGRELTERLLQQIAPLGATFHLNQVVLTLAAQADGRFLVETTCGTHSTTQPAARFLCKTIFIAAGVGAFQPRTVKLDGLDTFTGSQLFYAMPPAADLAGKDVVVLGEGEAALDCVVALAQPGPHAPRSITLVHRRDSFKADTATVATMKALCAARQMCFRVGQPTGYVVIDGRLTGLQVTDSEAVTHVLQVDVLLAFLGVSPKLGPVAQWGLALERKQLQVNTHDFCTSQPGIYAVGDINTYPGKRKLILCGFHEATLAAFGAAAYLVSGQAVHLQYTTTSPRLHQLLGLATDDQVPGA